MKESQARKALGADTAQILFRRIQMLRAAESLASLNTKVLNLHALKGDRKGQLTINLDKKNRLVFEPIIEEHVNLHDPNMAAPANYHLIRIIEIQYIGDYHR